MSAHRLGYRYCFSPKPEIRQYLYPRPDVHSGLNMYFLKVLPFCRFFTRKKSRKNKKRPRKRPRNPSPDRLGTALASSHLCRHRRTARSGSYRILLWVDERTLTAQRCATSWIGGNGELLLLFSLDLEGQRIHSAA